jgi:hypothetical protein
LYRDGKPFQSSIKTNKWLPADKVIETFSTQVNALAVLYDLTPEKLRPAIVSRFMARDDLNTQPYFMFFVFAALEHAGQFERYALAQMRRWQMVEDTQSYREMWGGGDLSHAWGSAPMIQLSATVLGVKPLTPGFRTFEVRPRSCGLNWARGTVPTPHGEIVVSWRRDAGILLIDVTVPVGCEAQVGVSKTKRIGAGQHRLEFRISDR